MALSDPLVTIVLATNECSRYLTATLDSVAAQSFTSWELILVDDGSTVPHLLRDIVAHHPQFRLLRQRPAGLSAARNRGLAEATGDFVAFLDHDDIWEPTHLSSGLAVLQQHPDAVSSFGPFHLIDANGERFDTRHYGYVDTTTILSGREQPNIVTLIVRRQAALAVGAFDVDFPMSEDIDFIYRLAMQGDFAYDDSVTVSYRKHATNMSGDTRLAGTGHVHAIEVNLRRARRLENQTAARALEANLQQARHYYSGRGLAEALAASRAGQVGAGISLAWWSVCLSPRSTIRHLRAGRTTPWLRVDPLAVSTAEVNSTS